MKYCHQYDINDLGECERCKKFRVLEECCGPYEDSLVEKYCLDCANDFYDYWDEMYRDYYGSY